MSNRHDDNGGENRSNIERSSNTDHTRRRLLKLAGGTGVSGLAFTGAAAADDEAQNGTNLTSESEWGTKDGGEIIAEGTSEFITSDEEAPEWYNIGKNDELRHKPKGIFRTQDGGICLGGTFDVSGFEVGLEFCHYGGCEWELKVCPVACFGTGVIEDCEGVITVSVGTSTSPVSGEVDTYPESVVPGTSVIVAQKIEGELCRYDPQDGRACYTMDLKVDLEEGTIE